MKTGLVRAVWVLVLMTAFARLTAAQGFFRHKHTADEAPITPDTVRVAPQLLPDTLVAVPPFVDSTSAQYRWAHTPPAMRELVADRINCLDSDMPHLFNGTVMSFVEYFTVRNRPYTQRILEREKLYFPLFEKYLAKYDLPQDLKYLAVVESALVPQARSRVGAVGLWQFMGPTAGDFRLVRNDYIDERMDPEKSTEAACKFLRSLYRMFGDWELALAAYNYGSGNVMKAIRKANGQRSFWAIYPYLPKETRNYVPTFTAALYTLKFAHEHGLHSDSLRYQYPEAMDTLIISGRSLDLRKLSAQFGLDSGEVARHNPEIRRTYLPETIQNYRLRVPACVRQELAVVDRNTLLEFCKVTLPPPAPLVPLVPPLAGDSARTALAAAAQPRYQRVRHTVRRGESLAAVANRYGVTAAQLTRWNKLTSGKALLPQQQLLVLVPVPPAAPPASAVAGVKASVPAKLPLSVASGKAPAIGADEAAMATRPGTQGPAAKPAVAVTQPNRNPAEATPEPGATSALPIVTAASDSLPDDYLVRRGDNLSKVAQRFGLTPAQLIEWNALRSATLVVGQKLVLAAPTETEDPTATAATAIRPPTRATGQPTRSAGQKTHLVQPGDTLYNISRRYEGVSVEQLRKLNNLKSDAVKPGQRLIVAG